VVVNCVVNLQNIKLRVCAITGKKKKCHYFQVFAEKWIWNRRWVVEKNQINKKITFW